MPMVAHERPLLAMYASDEPMPIIEAIEETLTIADPAGAAASAISARAIWNAPTTLTP
jgi:hypothetical protein